MTVVEFYVGKIDIDNTIVVWLEEIGIENWEPYVVGCNLRGLIFTSEQDATAFRLKFGTILYD
jgi:hypothetical protein